jgi:hypothetical protein
MIKAQENELQEIPNIRALYEIYSSHGGEYANRCLLDRCNL